MAKTRKQYDYNYMISIIKRDDNNIVVSRMEYFLFCDREKALQKYYRFFEKYYNSTSKVKVVLTSHTGVLKYYDTRKNRSK